MSPNRPTSETFKLTVNGREHEVMSRRDRPLLYVLRDDLGLSGPKYGCGSGDCGACAVLVDGTDTRSCSVPVADVRGEITTLEGLPELWGGVDSELHPVQQAWIDEQVPQCGYCQSGMMIAAVGLLSNVPDPSVEEIKTAFTSPDPHLCRCGTYAAIIRAVQRAARTMAEQ